MERTSLKEPPALFVVRRALQERQCHADNDQRVSERGGGLIRVMAFSVMMLGLAVAISGLRRHGDMGRAAVGVGVGFFLMALVMLVREPPMLISGDASLALAVPAGVVFLAGLLQFMRAGRNRSDATR